MMINKCGMPSVSNDCIAFINIDGIQVSEHDVPQHSTCFLQMIISYEQTMDYICLTVLHVCVNVFDKWIIRLTATWVLRYANFHESYNS